MLLLPSCLTTDKSGFITRDELVTAMKDIDQAVDVDAILASVSMASGRMPQRNVLSATPCLEARPRTEACQELCPYLAA